MDNGGVRGIKRRSLTLAPTIERDVNQQHLHFNFECSLACLPEENYYFIYKFTSETSESCISIVSTYQVENQRTGTNKGTPLDSDHLRFLIFNGAISCALVGLDL